MLRSFYIVASVRSGYAASRRTYATETAARRAAQRAADSQGEAFAYGLASGTALDGYTIKLQRGVATPKA